MIGIKNLRVTLTAVCLLIAGNGIFAQKMTPIVYNYSKADYHMDSKNWSVSGAEDGTMCFGNGAGLLIYDGIKWEKSKLPGGKTVRSVLCADERIYAGGFEEFGWFERDSTGVLRYTSLSDRLNGFEFQNDDIWTILNHDGKIVFHAFTALFTYDPESNSIEGQRLQNFIESIGQSSDGRLMCSYAGLSSLNPENGELHPLPEIPFKSRMVTILPYSEHQDLVVTLSDGLFILDGERLTRLDTDEDRFLRSTRLNRACLSRNGNYILGSSSDGCISIDRDGGCSWRLDSSTGLSDNTILGLSSDLEGNIWVATDAGISMILGESGPRYVAELSPSVGAVYSSYSYSDGSRLYIGTNQGLYTADLDQEKNLHNMRRIPQIEGNVWYIDNFDGQILCGTNGETWELSRNGVKPVHSSNIGGTCMAKGKIHGQDILVQGTYTELCIFLRRNGRWEYSHRIEGFVQPINSIGIDYIGNIWAAHNEEGMYRIRLNHSLNRIETLDYYQSLRTGGESTKMSVCTLDNRILFADGHAFYIYDDLGDRIVPYDRLNEALGRFSSATHISPGPDNAWWFVKEDEAGLFEFSDDAVLKLRYTLPFSIFNSRTVDSHTDIKAVGNEGSIVSLYNSLAWISADLSDSVKSPRPVNSKLILRGIRLSDGHKDDCRRLELGSESYSIPFKYRLIGIDFTCPQFSERDNIGFRYILHGRDKAWTDLGASESIDLNYLPEGRYTLEIEARSGSGELVDSESVTLRIQAPFYRSIPAKILYALAVIGIFALAIITALRHFREQKQELERQRLENELDAKSREITLSTMNLIRKNELLRDVKREMEEQKKSLGDAWPDRYYRKVVGSIDKFLDNDDDWEVFEQNFNRIHNGFFKTLKSKYPSLTPSDLRFCAYLCLNLTSKEIASMMNISLKGVEAARYRIRKKLALPSDVSLSEFLMGI